MSITDVMIQNLTDDVQRLMVENQRLTAENTRLKSSAKLYYRCDGCGGIIVRAPGNSAACERCDAPLGRSMMPDLWWHSESQRLTAELADIKDKVRYWSYCTSEGMRATCPEKVDELADFLIDLKIAPWYIRNTHCETVRTTDGGKEIES